MRPDIHPTANLYESEIGTGTKVAAFVEIGGAIVGCNCKIQAFSFLCPGVRIEDDVFIGPHVCFTNDRYPSVNGPWKQEETRVCRGASIGAGSIILPGVTIGAGSVVAAGSLVTTSIPPGHLYEERDGRSRLKRWYQTQEEIGLPLTFDRWREHYDSMTCAEQMDYYDAVHEQFPEQQHADIGAIREFFSQDRTEQTVLEIGGWDGAVAGIILSEYPYVRHWHNLELCRRAVDRGLSHSRYTARVLPDFIWESPELPECDVFVAAHTIEHLRAAQFAKLLKRLSGVRQMYLEAPLPASAIDHSWTGRWSTHILEIGWEQVEALAGDLAFKVRKRAPNIREFAR